MAATPKPLPSNEEALRIYQRLLQGDLLASTDVAEAYLDHLVAWLTDHNKGIDNHLCVEAAGEAILALIKNPNSYDPTRLSLEAYLRMSGQGDLLNILERERRHSTGRRTIRSVELSADARKYLGEDDDPSLPLQIDEEMKGAVEAIPPAVREGLSDPEIRVLELMLRGERKTEVYAKAYNIEHLPVAEQRLEIKRVKDRLQKRWDRRGGGMSKNLEWLAGWVSSDPFFLAAAISAYARSSQMEDKALAAKLGCPVDALVSLRLCRMPASAAPDFWRDIKLIAERFSVDPDELAEVVRQGQNVVRLQAAPDTKDESAGFLMAARDDEAGDGPPPAPGEPK